MDVIDSGRLSRLTDALSARPRVSLGQLPTPLEEAPRLSKRLGVRILIKRDDLTGLALGGNKVRKLEFLVADALARDADCIITTGGSQSNHARLTAAACRRTGLDCFLILDHGVHPEEQGNLLLDHLFGAHVRLIESADLAVAVEEMQRLGDDLEQKGRRPYIIPRGGSVPVGATGYVSCMVELQQQLTDADVEATHLYVGTGSTGTHSGMIAGVTAMGWQVIVQGVSVSRSKAMQTEKILGLANATLSHLGLEASVKTDSVHVDDRFVGQGYGHPTPATMESITMAALDEALIFDPVYTGKAFSGLVGHAREGRLSHADIAVFLHTGGAPALFAYHGEAMSALGAVPA
jgi:D-cysteine desulfhydrase family pyridoxal phosphate-dependent enzyme